MRRFFAAVSAVVASAAAASAVVPVGVGPAAAQSIEGVVSRTAELGDLRLANGQTLRNAKLAYETYGTLAPGGRNAVLITHGFTSSHHAAGRYAPGGAAKGVPASSLGSWDKMIGPGKPIDTNRFFVVSSNVLGSSYGSSAPADTDPATGKPYGPGFPAVTLHDMVDAQKRLLDKLGVKHLVAVAGGSYGGYQGFAWATRYPRMMDGVVVTVSAPNTTADAASVERLRADLARDPNWNGGQYYDKGGILPTMIDMRVATLKRCGIEAPLMAEFPDKDAREAEIRRRAEPWARAFDGNSLIVLRRASVGFDTRPMFKDIKAKVLYVLSSTDRVFPPEIAPRTMDALKAAGVDATYVLVDSIHGHSGATVDADKWLPDLKAFMDRVAPPPNAKPR